MYIDHRSTRFTGSNDRRAIRAVHWIKGAVIAFVAVIAVLGPIAAGQYAVFRWYAESGRAETAVFWLLAFHVLEMIIAILIANGAALWYLGRVERPRDIYTMPDGALRKRTLEPIPEVHPPIYGERVGDGFVVGTDNEK